MNGKELVRTILHKSLYNSAYSRALYTLWGVVLKEISLAFRQFFTWKYPVRSFFRVLGIITSSILRLFLGRSVKYSFAFTGEDKIIEGILKPLITKPGSYVDVGCNHPKFLSNTYGLYRKGWRGVCIDANQDLIDQYSFYRPKDRAICALVSNRVEARTYYKAENDVLSTVEAANFVEIKELNLSYKSLNITTKTLTSILDACHFPKVFDLLSIDAEEHDLNVLISLDFDRYQPTLVVVEDETFDFLNCKSNSFYTFLLERNYSLVAYVLKNAYYVKVEM
jgi:hypothetical protein